MEKTIIAGPCSVESREQLREVTAALSRMPQVTMIRAGVWKPRTRPGAFEGLGEPALRWIQELAKEFGVRYCCEVARPEHVALCQHYGIDTVWLGARTTGNPFMVEELCQALRGSKMAVLAKNPTSPDVRLWLGAIERLRAAGIDDITAVHRGFAMYHNQGYRNAPLWEVALELRREMPEIPILCDPSHIGGRAELVAPLAQAAMQLDYDGLMVEVHPHPEAALTDTKQQIDPAALAALLSVIRDSATSQPAGSDQHLAPLREEIDTVDHEMLTLLARRMELSRQIAAVKHEQGMAVYQSKRWEAVMNDRLRLAHEMGLDENFTKELLEKIHAESVRVQLETH
ncbi:MAG: bifunctional 3-deoxy-7-phosphoheptulonate synthase/chorismate mutase type II [Bacteroidales bacterium]|nr:bifunctional 3-deoxy-7-phosphoheptulonate synthase/chorismate mutase type II [Bacteroidales bacterium]